MRTPSSHTIDASFASEHATLNEILMGIMACEDLVQLIDGFDALEPVLVRHIDHEEAAGGTLAFLAGTGVAPGVVQKIRSEHRWFIGSVSTLRQETREFLTDDLCGDRLPEEISEMRGRIIAFSDSILTHEKYETQAYLAAASMRAPTRAGAYRSAQGAPPSCR
jgi:hypothetical protein